MHLLQVCLTVKMKQKGAIDLQHGAIDLITSHLPPMMIINMMSVVFNLPLLVPMSRERGVVYNEGTEIVQKCSGV